MIAVVVAIFSFNLIAVSSSIVEGFNLDLSTALVLCGQQNSYFGYSVALHKDRGVSWLLVGAPKAQTDQKGVHKGGAVYRCSPVNSNACQQVVFDPTGPNLMNNRGELKQIDDKSNQWFGATIQSATENGSIVSCAQKYTYFTSSYKRRDPIGTCWVSRGSFNGFLEYSPCRLYDQWGHHKLGSCQAGFAAALSKDGSRLFMGAPGSHVWQGRVFAHNLRTDLTNSTSANNPRADDDSYLGYSLTLGKFSAAAVLAAKSSSISGQHQHQLHDVTDVAIGVPRGAELVGKVVLVDDEMRPFANISGEQIGSYFGYSLATADVNGDGLDDLIIGAPLFYDYESAANKRSTTNTDSNKFELRFDTGRVYVALQNYRHELRIASRHDGRRNRARFGTSIANCGDLNLDGNQDIAIGAPYDGPDGHGAVYIYNGKHGFGGLNTEPNQVIYAQSVSQELRTFGWSLSGGVDLDGNSYSDLLVGDYEASRAVYFKSAPIVNVSTSIITQPDYFNLDEKNCLLPNSSTSVSCLTVQYCITYNGFGVDSKLAFVIDIKLDAERQTKGTPRLYLLNKEGKNEEKVFVILSKDVLHCKSFMTYIHRSIRDKLTPLKIDIDYELADYQLPPTSAITTTTDDAIDFKINNNYGAALKLKPVLNKINNQPNKITKLANIVKHCGGDNVCVPDLKLTMTTNVDQYTVGRNDKLIIDVTVKNSGEDAFESMFYLIMPSMINYINTNKTHRHDVPSCYAKLSDINILICDLANPQTRNEVIKFSIITEPGKGVYTSSEFTFLGIVNSTNGELDDARMEDNQVVIGIQLDMKIDLTLSGSSQPLSIVHNSTQFNLDNNSNTNNYKPVTSEADIGPEVYHVYHVYNKGPSTIQDIAVTILWPSKRADGKHLLYLVDEPLTSQKVRCKKAPQDTINPLGLKYQRGTSQMQAPIIHHQQQQQVSHRTQTNHSSPSSNQPPNYKPPYQANISSHSYFNDDTMRSKRQAYFDATDAIPSYHHKTLTATIAANNAKAADKTILQQTDDFFSCGPTQCTRFECNIFDLQFNEGATIKIRSRLYEETLSNVAHQDLDISSKAIVRVQLPPNYQQPQNLSSILVTMLPIYKKAVTQVHISGVSIQRRPPWWLVLISMLVGILLFSLLALFLKRLGFFERRRLPPRLATTKRRQHAGTAEREPLEASVWDDYQYSPGDTAL